MQIILLPVFETIYVPINLHTFNTLLTNAALKQQDVL